MPNTTRVLCVIFFVLVTSAVQVQCSSRGFVNIGKRGALLWRPWPTPRQYNATQFTRWHNRTHHHPSGGVPTTNATYGWTWNTTTLYNGGRPIALDWYQPSSPRLNHSRHTPWRYPRRSKRWITYNSKEATVQPLATSNHLLTTSGEYPNEITQSTNENHKEIKPTVHQTYYIGEALRLFRENDHHETETSPYNTGQVIIQAPIRKTNCGPRMRMARGRCRLIW